MFTVVRTTIRITINAQPKTTRKMRRGFFLKFLQSCGELSSGGKVRQKLFSSQKESRIRKLYVVSAFAWLSWVLLTGVASVLSLIAEMLRICFDHVLVEAWNLFTFCITLLSSTLMDWWRFLPLFSFVSPTLIRLFDFILSLFRLVSRTPWGFKVRVREK